jgi:hypothetical protein
MDMNKEEKNRARERQDKKCKFIFLSFVINEINEIRMEERERKRDQKNRWVSERETETVCVQELTKREES